LPRAAPQGDRPAPGLRNPQPDFYRACDVRGRRARAWRRGDRHRKREGEPRRKSPHSAQPRAGPSRSRTLFQVPWKHVARRLRTELFLYQRAGARHRRAHPPHDSEDRSHGHALSGDRGDLPGGAGRAAGEPIWRSGGADPEHARRHRPQFRLGARPGSSLLQYARSASRYVGGQPHRAGLSLSHPSGSDPGRPAHGAPDPAHPSQHD
jgi:hypothetical protein